jgi:alpha-L-fucosidase
MPYEPTWESVSTHPLPPWYDDAKLGVFLHWGLFSVPGWAPQVDDIQQLLKAEGPAGMLRDNPYAEWYANSVQIEGSPTQVHHRQTYGPDFAYDDFIPLFNEGANGADLDSIAALCKGAGRSMSCSPRSTMRASPCGRAQFPIPARAATTPSATSSGT